jgi:hypothetical protein
MSNALACSVSPVWRNGLESGRWMMEKDHALLPFLGISPLCREKVATPGFPTCDAPPVPGLVNPEDRTTVAIFRAVIRRLYKVDHASGEDLLHPRLFLLFAAGATCAAPFPRGIDHKPISESIRRWLLQSVDDLPVKIVWLEQTARIVCQPDRWCFDNKGMLVAFHGIRSDHGDIVLVDGSIRRWNQPVFGFEHVVENRTGSWTVKSTYQKRIH